MENKEQRKVTFYGAVTLDGYIAGEDDSLEWLFDVDGEAETGFEDFYQTVDTIMMGRRTYEQIKELSPDEFPYRGMECYIFSKTLEEKNPYFKVIDTDLEMFIKRMKMQDAGRLWVVGGGDLVTQLVRKNLIDEFIIQVAPSIIGNGIRLFGEGDYEQILELTDVRRYKQFAELHYVKKKR